MSFGNSSYGGAGGQGLDSLGGSSAKTNTHSGRDYSKSKTDTKGGETRHSGLAHAQDDMHSIANGNWSGGGSGGDTERSWNLVDGWHDVNTQLSKPSLFGNGRMATPYGWKNFDAYERERDYYRGVSRSNALSQWNDVLRPGLQQSMLDQNMPHHMRDVYQTAFDHGRFDQIPDSVLSPSAKSAAQSALDALNDPLSSALGLAQTPYEATNDLARDLTFSNLEGVNLGDNYHEDGQTLPEKGGDMGLKPSSVFGKIFGGKRGYEVPARAGLGTAAMLTGQSMTGLPGKITQALGKGMLTSAFTPGNALSTMWGVFDLARTAHVAGVAAPERNTFDAGTESGGVLPVQTLQTASVSSSPASSISRAISSVTGGGGFYSPRSAYGYTLL